MITMTPMSTVENDVAKILAELQALTEQSNDLMGASRIISEQMNEIAARSQELRQRMEDIERRRFS
jgi:uncharacterized protein (DUF3084 family)